MANIQVAVVTGASGFVGSQITKQLLESGYTVRAATRDPSRNEHLELLGKALPGTLEQWAVKDIQKEGAFDKIVEGATFVFHCAATVAFGTGNEEEDRRVLVDPAVKGTISVLNSVAKSKSVKRVVFTSSAAALRPLGDDPSAQIYTDKDWLENVTMALPYFLAKRDSERIAWKLAKENNIDLVTIIPTFVTGPIINPKPGVNVMSIQVALGNKPIYEGFPIDVNVDVRDVAKAHILAAELPHAKGRYIVTLNQVTNRRKLAQDLREAYPEFTVQDCPDEPTVQLFDTSRLQELGMTDLIPVKKSILDQARSVFALGLGPEP